MKKYNRNEISMEELENVNGAAKNILWGDASAIAGGFDGGCNDLIANALGDISRRIGQTIQSRREGKAEANTIEHNVILEL